MTHMRPSDENNFGGSWSIKKLECIESYLDSYLDVMAKQEWADLWYVDAFSGDGYQQLRDDGSVDDTLSLFDEELEYANSIIEGSAIRAIRLSAQRENAGFRPFNHFVFLEYSKDKLQRLQKAISVGYPNQITKCQFILGDTNETMPNVLKGIDWRNGRAVAFLDPCATQLKWDTIEAFKNTCADIWLLFPLGAVLRMLSKDRIPSAGLAKTIDVFFGDSSWRSLYHEPTVEQPSLFGATSSALRRDSGYSEVIKYATKRFREAFPEVIDPAILRNVRNAPLFALFAMVSNNSQRAREISRRIATDLIRKIDDSPGA